MTAEEKFFNELYDNLKLSMNNIPDAIAKIVTRCDIVIQPHSKEFLDFASLKFYDESLEKDEHNLFVEREYEISQELSLERELFFHLIDNNTIGIMSFKDNNNFNEYIKELGCYPTEEEHYYLSLPQDMKKFLPYHRHSGKGLDDSEFKKYEDIATRLCNFCESTFPKLLSKVIIKLYEDDFILEKFKKEIRVTFDYCAGLFFNIPACGYFEIHTIFPDEKSKWE